VNDNVAELFDDTLVPSFALNTTSSNPKSDSDGVPDKEAVPSPLSVNANQDGKVSPETVGTSVSASVVVTVCEYSTPGSASVTGVQLNAGVLFTWLTVTTLVIVCVPPAPSLKVKVNVLSTGVPGLTSGAVNVGFFAAASDRLMALSVDAHE
jgi:hypothetical protein